MPTAPAAPPPILDRVTAEQVRGHYAQIPAMVIAPTLGGLYTVWVLWDAVDNLTLAVGISAVAVLSAVRLLLWRHYMGLSDERKAERRWRTLAVVVSGVSGCLWGSVAPLLYPPQVADYEVYLVVLMTMLPILPVAALAVYMPTFYAYCLPCVAPFVLTLALQPSRAEKTAAILLVMMTVAMLTFARRYSQGFAEAVELRLRLGEQSQALGEAVRQRTEFIAAAGHDLRQPVHSMGLFLESLRTQDQRPEDAPLIAQLEAAQRSLSAMLTNILDAARLDATPVAVQRQPVALHVLLAQLATEHAPLAALKGLGWRLRCKAPAWADSDPILLERILRNLLANALKYTPSGGVALLCRTQGPGLRVQVVDTGVGIPVDQADSVFEPFHRLAPVGRAPVDGLGLGLSIARRMAGLLGHSLSLRSNPGSGSVFTLDLPRAPVAGDEAPQRRTAALPDMPAGWIMVIDDDSQAGAAVAGVLRQWGHRTTVSGGTADALAVLARERAAPQLLIVDRWLAAGASGLDAVLAVRQRAGSALPAIIVTGDVSTAVAHQAYEAGHVLLQKPVDAGRLRTCLALICRPRG